LRAIDLTQENAFTLSYLTDKSHINKTDNRLSPAAIEHSKAMIFDVDNPSSGWGWAQNVAELKRIPTLPRLLSQSTLRQKIKIPNNGVFNTNFSDISSVTTVLLYQRQSRKSKKKWLLKGHK
jgi:hypothetical protein